MKMIQGIPVYNAEERGLLEISRANHKKGDVYILYFRENGQTHYQVDLAGERCLGVVYRRRDAVKVAKLFSAFPGVFEEQEQLDARGDDGARHLEKEMDRLETEGNDHA